MRYHGKSDFITGKDMRSMKFNCFDGVFEVTRINIVCSSILEFSKIVLLIIINIISTLMQ